MAIDIKNSLVVNYELKLHRNPNYQFFINDILITKTQGSITFSLSDIIIFKLCNINGDGAIEIVKISLNEVEILPKYLSKANPPTNWIENLNDWSFVMYKPFHCFMQEITGQGEIF